MFTSSLTLCFTYVFFVFTIGEINSRKLTITYNEDCNIPKCNNENNTSNAYNLAHITAVGDNDTVHYIWSSIGGPTIILAVTDHESQLRVDWKELLEDYDVSNSIQFTSKPIYSMALVITKLIEFNDTKDTADVANPKNNLTDITALDELEWLDLNETIDYENFSGTFQSLNETINSTLSVKMTAYEKAGRDGTLPHLQYTENATQFEFSIDMFPSHFNNSRYAVEVLMVSEKTADKYVKKSIDDEYTPSIFSIINFIAPASSGSSLGSFSQWKPVVYSQSKKALNVSLQCHETKVIPYNDTLPSRSVVRGFFDLSHVQLSALNITFGTSGDKFYKHTNYTSWSATVGYGEPPVESLSELVIIVISAGLGIPVLICIGGGIFTCIKKWKISKSIKKMNSTRYPTISSVN